MCVRVSLSHSPPPVVSLHKSKSIIPFVLHIVCAYGVRVLYAKRTVFIQTRSSHALKTSFVCGTMRKTCTYCIIKRNVNIYIYIFFSNDLKPFLFNAVIIDGRVISEYFNKKKKKVLKKKEPPYNHGQCTIKKPNRFQMEKKNVFLSLGVSFS